MQHVPVGDALVAEGHQHGHRLVPRAGDQVGQRVQREHVGPLQVVDDQQDRAGLGEPGDGPVDHVQGARGGVGVPVAAVQRREVHAVDRSALDPQALERRDEREVRRRLGAEAQAPGPQHRVPGGA